MTDSILNNIKKMLGIGADYEAFDTDIVIAINSAIANLGQLGVGPPEGFQIVDSQQVWSDLLGDDLMLNTAKTYIYLRVRLMFDPPTTSFLINAYEQQLRELEWRISSHREANEWTPPVVEDDEDVEELIIIDGGTP